MTPDEQARLARVEAEAKALREELRATRGEMKAMNEKLDRLCEIAAMGKGAWYAILRVGAVLAVLAGAGWTIFTFVKR